MCLCFNDFRDFPSDAVDSDPSEVVLLSQPFPRDATSECPSSKSSAGGPVLNELEVVCARVGVCRGRSLSFDTLGFKYLSQN